MRVSRRDRTRRRQDTGTQPAIPAPARLTRSPGTETIGTPPDTAPARVAAEAWGGGAAEQSAVGGRANARMAPALVMRFVAAIFDPVRRVVSHGETGACRALRRDL